MNIISSIVILQTLFIGSKLIGNDRELTASQLSAPPTIDGRLDEEAWKNGSWVTDFTLTSDPEKLAEKQTEFQIAYDDENLYLAARIEEPESEDLKIEEFRRDGSISQDDSLELILDSSCDRLRCFHFGSNSVGIQYDAKQKLSGDAHDVQWNANWKAATKIGSNEWTLEMAIPLAELMILKQSEEGWGFNIVRQRWAGNNREISSYSPMNVLKQQRQKFSKLYLPKLRFDKFFWVIKRPFDYHIEADKGDWILTGKLRIKNDGSENGKIKIIFKQVSPKGAMVGQVLTDDLLLGKEKEYVFRLPIERQEPVVLQIEIVNAENAKEIYRSRREILDVSYKSMDIDLISPGYRKSIYSSQSIDEIRMTVRLALTPKVLIGSKLSLRLIGEKTRNVVSHRELGDLTNMQEVYLPLGDIVAGEYIIEGQVIDSRGEVVAKSTKVLKKLRQEDNEWRLDGNKNLLHNGKPFLPEGWFKILPDDIARIGLSTYNALFLPQDVIEGEEKIKTYLDSVEKINAYAILYPYPNSAMLSSQKDLGRLLTSAEIKIVQQRVKLLKKHPALMAWMIADQPEAESVLPERIRQIYAIIAEEDPYHPVVLVNSSIKGIRQYGGIADITMATTFIPSTQGEIVARPIDSVTFYLDVANKMNQKRSLWVGLQAYDYENDWNEAVRLLSFLELRNMVYQSVIREVKGFFWQDYRYVYNYPEFKINADFLSKELSLVQDAIFAPKVSQWVTLECENKSAIYLLHKIVDEDHYLFVVNTDSKPQSVKFETPLMNAIEKLYVVSENRVVAVNNDQFNEHFGPYATHIYSTKDFKGKGGSLKEVEESIELATKAKKKRGNSAFVDTNVKIVASSNSPSSSIKNINDGVFGGLSWSSKANEPLPQWIELTWPEKIWVGKIILFSDTIERAKLQMKQDGEWVDICDINRRNGAYFKALFPERELQEIRIVITEKRLGADCVSLSEIEVYNPLTRGRD